MHMNVVILNIELQSLLEFAELWITASSTNSDDGVTSDDGVCWEGTFSLFRPTVACVLSGSHLTFILMSELCALSCVACFGNRRI